MVHKRDGITQIFFSLPIERIVYVTNFSAQYLYLIRRQSALSFSGKEAMTWVILMTGSVVHAGGRS
jgi:hypothetical protein